MKIFNPFKYLLYIPVWIYKGVISPLLPHTCRFTPSCSDYFLKAVEDFGIFKGFFMGAKRIARCRPGGKSGFDPVPINLKGESKWLF